MIQQSHDDSMNSFRVNLTTETVQYSKRSTIQSFHITTIIVILLSLFYQSMFQLEWIISESHLDTLSSRSSGF